MVRRIGRYLRLLFAAVLLLLWLAVGVVWVRSYWRGDQIVWQRNRELPIEGVSFTRRQTDQYIVLSGDGGICLGMRHVQFQTYTDSQTWNTAKDPEYPKPWTGAGGALVVRGTSTLAGSTPTTTP